MSSHEAHYFVAFVILLMHSSIVSVNGQCTIEICETGDTSSSIIAAIQQLKVDLFDHVKKEVQNVHTLLTTALKQVTDQNDAIMRSLQTGDRRPEEHDTHIKQIQNIYELFNESMQEIKSFQAINRLPQEHNTCIQQGQSIHKLLNESFYEIKTQHRTAMTNLEADDRRRLHEHDSYIKQGQSIYNFLNESFNEVKNQHENVMRSLQAANLRSQEQDISIKNQSRNAWKLANEIFDPASQVWDCAHIKANGQTENGVYEICVGHRLNRICTSAFCDMRTNNAASLVFQRRKDGSDHFNRTWTEYERGFGNRNGEFWLGNEMLYRLTSNRNYRLRIDLEDFHGNKSFAEYARFSISSYADNYRMSVSGYSGNAGDSLYHHNGRRFTTFDVDNDDDTNPHHCGIKYGAGWWFHSCFIVNLNGLYYNQYDAQSGVLPMGIVWYHWRGYYYSLKATEMKLIPVS